MALTALPFLSRSNYLCSRTSLRCGAKLIKNNKTDCCRALSAGCHGYSSRWTAKHVIFAGAVGGASLVALTRHKLLKVHAESNPWEVSPRPEPTPSRVMNYGLDLGIKITLYQYQTCPFCCKARAFLDYYGISYDVVEVNSVKRTEVKWSKYKKVPLLLVQTPEGKTVQINDSSQIVSVLQTFIDTKMKITIDQIANYYPHFEDKGEGMFARTTFDFPNKYFIMYLDEGTVSKSTAKLRNFERKWRMWVDSDFVHRISPNIYGTFAESFQAFKYFEKVGNWEKIFSWWDRLVVCYLGGFVMRLVAMNLKRKHELDDDVRMELYHSVQRFTKGALNRGAFTGGDSITLADLALYGVMTSFEGCDAFRDMTENSDISTWFQAVKKAVEGHEGQRIIRTILETDVGEVEGGTLGVAVSEVEVVEEVGEAVLA